MNDKHKCRAIDRIRREIDMIESQLLSLKMQQATGLLVSEAKQRMFGNLDAFRVAIIIIQSEDNYD